MLHVDRISIQLGGNNEGRQRKRISRKALGVVPSTPPFLPPCALHARRFLLLILTFSPPSFSRPSDVLSLAQPPGRSHRKKAFDVEGVGAKRQDSKLHVQNDGRYAKHAHCKKIKKKSWQTTRATPVTDCMFVCLPIPSRTFGGR